MSSKKSRLPSIDEGGGGTKMYCPHCQEITECRALNPTLLGEEAGQRWHRTDHTDINWFRRARQCMTCANGFLTAEVAEDFLEELVELRKALGDIKLHAEQYLRESTSAAKSLNKLADSLKVLKALNVYKSRKT